MLEHFVLGSCMTPNLFQMSGSSMLYISAETQGLVTFFSVFPHQLVADRPGFSWSCPLGWCGVSFIPQEGKATKLLLSWQKQTKPSLGTNISSSVPHLGLRLRGFGSGSSQRRNRMAEKHFWKLEVKTWQWKVLLFLPGLWFVNGSMSHQALFTPAQNSTAKPANSFNSNNFQSLSHNTNWGPDPEIMEVFPWIESEPEMAEPEREK